MNQQRILDYVLVPDVVAGNEICYYAGYYMSGYPMNEKDYTKALKIAYKNEAESLCKIINETTQFPYHVEEHCYINVPVTVLDGRLLELLEAKLKTSKACKFRLGKMAKRLESEWVVKYTWELYDSNNTQIAQSEWIGFDSLTDSVADLVKNIK